MEEQGLNKAEYWWYLDLRRFGTVPHSGFGLGLERMVQFVDFRHVPVCWRRACRSAMMMARLAATTDGQKPLRRPPGSYLVLFSHWGRFPWTMKLCG